MKKLARLTVALRALAPVTSAFAGQEVIVDSNGPSGDSYASTGTDTFIPLAANPGF